MVEDGSCLLGVPGAPGGTITGADIVPGTTTWTGQFDCSVRFDEDTADFSVDQPGDVSTPVASFAGGWRSIRLLEVRPPPLGSS